ncbi:MAG TPA: hypothetical protein VJ891_08600 [Casimicrobiaceae bacterium]|nr:hypothetical protein [Casimicrobiaceae bacterium]
MTFIIALASCTSHQREPTKAEAARSTVSALAARWQACAVALRSANQNEAANRADQYAHALTMQPFGGGAQGEPAAATAFVKESAHQAATTALNSVAALPGDCSGL